MNAAERIFPIKTAYSGLCCTNCMESPSSSSLLQCSRCKQAKYCNRKCQRADWSKHKGSCRFLQIFSESYPNFPPSTLMQKVGIMNRRVKRMAQEGLITEEQEKCWPLARHYIQFCRICMVCHLSEYDFMHSDNASTPHWVNCSTCEFGWCCSNDHWEEYSSRHSAEICSKYCMVVDIGRFEWNHCKNYDDIFSFSPNSTLSEPMEAFPVNWKDYWEARCPEMYALADGDQLPIEIFPASTKQLSQPVTCLFAMYQHGIEHFQNLPLLSIHVVGASASFEIPPTSVWEEIMHCLPCIQKLNVEFVGPEACSFIMPPTNDLEIPFNMCCPTCTAQNRTRSTAMRGQAYHEFQASIDKWSRPDLIVAFNTGMHEEHTDSWETSLEGILDLDVPALFTSYNKQEADQDFALLQSMNANICVNEPILNHLAVMKPEMEPCGLDKFFHHNMYRIPFQGRAE